MKETLKCFVRSSCVRRSRFVSALWIVLVSLLLLPLCELGHVVRRVKMAAAKRKRGGAEARPKKKVKFVENGEKEKNASTEPETSTEITVPPPVSQVRVYLLYF